MRIGIWVLGSIGACLVFACGSSDGGGDAGHGGSLGVGGNGRAGGTNASDGGRTGDAGAGAGNEAGAAGTETAGSEAGSANPSAGAGGEAGAGSSVIPNLIDLDHTRFLEYGKLRVVFKQPVDAASLELKLVPNKPSRLRVTSVARVDSASVDVTLAFYHLPIDYELRVTGELADGTSFQTSATLGGSNNGARVAFLSKQSGSGKIGTWSEASAVAVTGLEAADSVCQFEADAAGFKGKFVALLSAHQSYDAACRALGLSGLVADKCGQAKMPSDAAPWLSPLGYPIANGADQVAADDFETPFAHFADGSLGTQVSVWIGSEPGAIASNGTISDCGGWSQETSYGLTNTFSSDYLLEYARASSTCDAAQHLICLQVGGSFFARSTLHAASGKRAFVSKGEVFGNAGRTAADTLCQTEAGDAGYANAAKFYAYLGTADDDALCHVLGGSGRVTAQCGLASLPTGTWRRADDYPLASAGALFGAGALLAAPISLSADQSQSLDKRPWTGASSTGVTGSNCGDWTTSSGTAEVGTPRCTTGSWQFFSTANCSTSAPVYCFER